jgi:FkbM family methyltransferase
MITFKSHQALDYIVPHLPSNPIIVEAGAYIGTDTTKMALRWPAGIIHAFEPVPELHAYLCANTLTHNNVRRYQLALSNTAVRTDFYIGEKPDNPGRATQAGSLHAPKERLLLSPIQFPRTITVQTITLDAWAHQHAVTSVDMLWLDLQGHELAVLQASPQILSTVSVIFTEIAFVEAYEQQPSAEDIIHLLALHGFVAIGRDFSDSPQWFFGNMLFIKQR